MFPLFASLETVSEVVKPRGRAGSKNAPAKKVRLASYTITFAMVAS